MPKLKSTVKYQEKINELGEQVRLKAVELQKVQEKLDRAKKETQGEIIRKNFLLVKHKKIQDEIGEMDKEKARLQGLVQKAEAKLEITKQQNEELMAEMTERHSLLKGTVDKLKEASTELAESEDKLATGQKELVSLRVSLGEARERNTLTERELDEKKTEIEKKTAKLNEQLEHYQKTFTQMVRFAGMIEHNTMRLNKLYAKGAIKIKVKIPDFEVGEFVPFK